MLLDCVGAASRYLGPRPATVLIPGHDPGAWAELAAIYS
jgi:hypothetical protein